MFFITRFHLPKFSLNDYERRTKDAVKNAPISLAPNQYQWLLRLEKHASIFADSLHQLKSVVSKETYTSLENVFKNGIYARINYPDRLSMNPESIDESLRRNFGSIKRELKEGSMCNKMSSGILIVTNSIISAISCAGIVLSAMTLCTGPIGVALLGVVAILMSAALLALAAYSIYVDGKILFNKQLTDIERSIDFLLNDKYPPPAEQGHNSIIPTAFPV